MTTHRFTAGQIVVPNATFRRYFAKHMPFKRCLLAFDHTQIRHVSRHSQPLQRQFHKALMQERRAKERQERDVLHDAMLIAVSWASMVEAAQDVCNAAFDPAAEPGAASAALATLHQRLRESRGAARRMHAAPPDLPDLVVREPVAVEVRPVGAAAPATGQDLVAFREILFAIQDAKHVLFEARSRAAGAQDESRINAVLAQLTSAQTKVSGLLARVEATSREIKALEERVEHAAGLAGEWIDARVHRARMQALQQALDSQSRHRSQLAADVRRLEAENAELRRKQVQVQCVSGGSGGTGTQLPGGGGAGAGGSP